MNIAIIGYGKMGKEIAKIAEEKGHTIGLAIDLNNASELNGGNLKDIDVAIEFSSPNSAFENISTCLRSGTPVVVGTTGWLDRWDEILSICDDQNGGLFYASNFSIGVNILFSINTYLAELMKNFPAYDVSIEEIHHIHKLDSPSGTAITLANQIIEKLATMNNWSLQKANSGKIHIDAKRQGEVNGFHKVIYDSEIDSITISHNAKSRKGFAEGAVMAAEFMKDKTGIHGMNEMLNL